MQSLFVRRYLNGKNSTHKRLSRKTVVDKWKKKKLTKKEKVKQFCVYILPLVLLITIILILSCIYYAVEKGCQTSFMCKTRDFQIVNNLDENISLYLTQSQMDKLKNGYKHILPTLDYWESLHFVMITLTTIGYGDVVPCTVEGQIVALITALIGMPIMVLSLARLGRTIGLFLHKLWRSVYTGLFKPPYAEHRLRQLLNENYVPLSAGICITLIWILICSFYFYATLSSIYKEDDKKFTFVNALYFTMISFLTIGFGEYAPIRYELIWLNMIMLMVGLSMVALCIRLFQINMEDLIDNIVDKIDVDYTEDAEIKHMTRLGEEDNGEIIKHIIDEQKHKAGVVTKVLMVSMGSTQQKRLVEKFEGKSKFITSSSQTSETYCRDFQAQVSSRNLPKRKSSPVLYKNAACQADLDIDEFDEYEDFDNPYLILPTNSLKRKSKLQVRQSVHPKRLKRHL